MLISLYLQQIETVLVEHPFLKFDHKRNRFHGSLLVDKKDDDLYRVEIDLWPFPNRFPTVWEVGERIPRKVERHIFTTSKACCFTTDAKEQILVAKYIKTLLDFINKIAIPYFQNNSYFEIEGKYKNGEYSHTAFGPLEGYGDILGINSLKIITSVLLDRLARKKYHRNYPCYCGINKKIKKCHLGNYKDLKHVSNATIRNDLTILFAQLNQLRTVVNDSNTQMHQN